jgi:hypothetical protein
VDWNFLVDFWANYNRFLAHVINSLPILPVVLLLLFDGARGFQCINKRLREQSRYIRQILFSFAHRRLRFGPVTRLKRLAQNLVQVMLEVRDVVFSDPPQRSRRVLADVACDLRGFRRQARGPPRLTTNGFPLQC